MSSSALPLERTFPRLILGLGAEQRGTNAPLGCQTFMSDDASEPGRFGENVCYLTERSYRNSARKPYFPPQTAGQLSNAHGIPSDDRWCGQEAVGRAWGGFTLGWPVLWAEVWTPGAEENHQWGVGYPWQVLLWQERPLVVFLNFRLI